MTADTGASAAVKHIHADFNTLSSAPVGVVKLAAPGSWQEAGLPPLTNGERVTLFDADGLEVEATVTVDNAGWWLATPDDPTWREGVPPEISLPTAERR